MELGHETPRLHFRGVTRLPLKKGATLMLIDTLSSTLIPMAMRLKPPKSMTITAAGRGISCEMACQNVDRHVANEYIFKSTIMLLERYSARNSGAYTYEYLM